MRHLFPAEVCTNSCRKKSFGEQLGGRDTLALPLGSGVSEFHTATFVTQRVPNVIGACACSRRGGISEA